MLHPIKTVIRSTSEYHPHPPLLLALLLFITPCLLPCLALDPAQASSPYLSPSSLVASKDGSALFIACETAHSILRLDTQSRKVTASIPVPSTPTGLALSPDGSRLFVTCASPQSKVLVLDSDSRTVLATLVAGHTATAPVPSPDGQTLYVCNRFNDDVSILDLATLKERHRIKVRREPIAAALTPDGRFLLVANHLHDGRANVGRVSAVVSVIDTAKAAVVKELTLPSGGGVLQDIRIAPDGQHAVVTHLLGRYQLPTTQLERGWMNTNAKSIIHLGRMEILDTVLLDSVDSGAANPWGVAWSADNSRLVITHAGTHELSVVRFPELLAKLTQPPSSQGKPIATPNDLAFLVNLRQRIKLPPADRGPRAVAILGSRAYLACYFSDSLATIDLTDPHPAWESIPLGPTPQPNIVRRGEELFHDATICFQGWQSCASCHPGDGRVDALNWDLLNDGIGNPKNNKSLLLSHRTPPAMSMGIRDTAETAVRAGLRHILFTVQPESVSKAMDEYLKKLQPVPSPHLVNGKLSPAARRGLKIFNKAGCASCHPKPLFTDLQAYDVGTHGPYDKPTDRFDTPVLIELWRTAPYLHDGSAATIRDVFTEANPRDQHGETSRLSPKALDDLCAYLLSL